MTAPFEAALREAARLLAVLAAPVLLAVLAAGLLAAIGFLAVSALAAGLALPTLLALAVVELCAGMIGRVERAAALDAGAPRLARAARPIVALLLFCASLAAFAEGIGAHMLR